MILFSFKFFLAKLTRSIFFSIPNIFESGNFFDKYTKIIPEPVPNSIHLVYLLTEDANNTESIPILKPCLG